MQSHSSEVMRTLFEKLVELDEISSQDDEILRSLTAQSDKLSMMTNKLLSRDPEIEMYKLARQSIAKGSLKIPHPDSQGQENKLEDLNASHHGGSQASFGQPPAKQVPQSLVHTRVVPKKPATAAPAPPAGPAKPKLTGKDTSQAANKHTAQMREQEGNMKTRIEKMLKYCR